jgi:hypothetical protein
MNFLFCLVAILVSFASCRPSAVREEITIYTSMTPRGVELMSQAMVSRAPNLKINWFQGGSETINAKIAT